MKNATVKTRLLTCLLLVTGLMSLVQAEPDSEGAYVDSELPQKPPLQKIEARMIEQVIYDSDTRDLKIRLRHRGEYLFQGVPPLVYQEFLDTDHKARLFNDHIRLSYKTIRLPQRRIESLDRREPLAGPCIRQAYGYE